MPRSLPERFVPDTIEADMVVRELTRDDASSCDAIVATLPYHFGDARGRSACAAAVRSQPGLVATVKDEVIAFLTVGHHHARSAEITWMAVRDDRRRRGVGRALVGRLAADLRARGVQLLFVLTLGPSAGEPRRNDNYEDTRRFYEDMGFIPLRELLLTDWRSPALLLVRPLEP